MIVRDRRALDAVLLLDKPRGITSNAALQRARAALGAAKAGHCGTLDPLASGLLPALFGEATKLAGELLAADKTYRARLRLGVVTASGDTEGEVLERHPVRIEAARLAAAVARFTGPIEQVPPMYSALKRAGRPLYALAREGRTVERAPRRVTVHALQVLAQGEDWIELHLRCSKGTYVRSLAHDLGRELGCGACVEELRRTAIAAYAVEDAVPLERLESAPEAERQAWLLPLDHLLQGLPRIDLAATIAERFAHGQAIALGAELRGRCRVYRAGGELLGLGCVGASGELRALRLVAREGPKRLK